MPQIKSLSDFNRNQNAMIEELEETGEPLYLTLRLPPALLSWIQPPSTGP